MAGRRQMSQKYAVPTTGRLIPRRGQVKAAIVIGLAHSVASFFSLNRRGSSARHAF